MSVLACNHTDAERLQDAINANALTGAITLEPTYVVPPGYAFVTSGEPLEDQVYEQLNVRKYI